MSAKIKAFIVNRNLVTTLQKTVDFLLKENRVEVVIFDQDSTYPPLLEYYKTCGVKIVYAGVNGGPHSTWGPKLAPEFNNEYFILADSDCSYEGVPDDWLDKMINVLKLTNHFKVGFSLRLNDLPDTPLGRMARTAEARYWIDKNEYGWVADIDTTFALYRPHSPFSYRALRLDDPYCIKHHMWYLTKEELPDEWRYYLDHASGVSTWGSQLKLT